MGNLNLHDGDYSCNGRGNNAEDAESAEGAEKKRGTQEHRPRPKTHTQNRRMGHPAQRRKEEPKSTGRSACATGWEQPKSTGRSACATGGEQPKSTARNGCATGGAFFRRGGVG